MPRDLKPAIARRDGYVYGWFSNMQRAVKTLDPFQTEMSWKLSQVANFLGKTL